MDDCGARCGAGWHGDGAWRCRGPHFVRLNIVEAPSAKLILTGRVSMGGRTGSRWGRLAWGRCVAVSGAALCAVKYSGSAFGETYAYGSGEYGGPHWGRGEGGWHGDGVWRCRGPHFVRLNMVEAPSAKLFFSRSFAALRMTVGRRCATSHFAVFSGGRRAVIYAAGARG